MAVTSKTIILTIAVVLICHLSYAEGIYGPEKTYFSDGKLASETLADGTHKEYYPNGILKGEYRMMPEKDWRRGSDYIQITKDGPVKSYYENGRLANEYNLIDWLREGISHSYFESGLLQTELSYSKGILVGRAKYYFLNGQLSKEFVYKDGVMTDDYKEYYEDGKIKYENVAKGNEVIKKTYDSGGHLALEDKYVDKQWISQKTYENEKLLLDRILENGIWKDAEGRK